MRSPIHDAYVRDAGVWQISRRGYDRLFMRMGRDGLVVSPFPSDAPDF